MKALCAGAFLDPTVQQTQLQNPPGLSNDRRLGGGGGGGGAGSEGSGMDFVDSAPSAPSAAHHHHHPHRKPPPRLSSPQPTVATPDASGGTANNFRASSEMDADSSASRPVSSDLTLLKSPVSQTQQRLLLLHGLSALKESGASAAGGGGSGGTRKGEEADYSSSAWMSSLPEQKPKFPEDEMDNRPPSSSPHIHPVKRVLKRFGNEQHRLSQLQKQQQQQQQSVGKPDPDKTQ